MSNTFRALRISEESDGTFKKQIATRTLDELPQHEVLIKVKYAALNYKDALSANGHKGITRKFPHTPGVDAAGEVVEDSTGTFKKGDAVICTSYDLGMNTDGGFAEYIRVPAAWLVPMPAKFTFKQAMVLGTAAFTAALALHKMEVNGQEPSMGSILVTGSTGGVGTMAVSLLNHCGYQVITSTGKKEKHEFLKAIGAHKIIGRDDVRDESPKAFLSTQWAGAIDTVGGVTLSTILKACGHNGNVATCGLVESAEFSTTVYPFIIKGNNLLGVETAECNMTLRKQLWDKLANEWAFSFPESLVTECSLDEIIHHIDQIMEGKVTGRVVVNLDQ